MPKKPPVAHTIGTNPLDLVVAAQPVAAMAGKGAQGRVRRPGERPATTVLTVTVPSDLADALEQIIAITPGTDLDSLASEALQAVLARLGRGAKGGSKGRGRAKSARDDGPMLVIVGE